MGRRAKYLRFVTTLVFCLSFVAVSRAQIPDEAFPQTASAPPGPIVPLIVAKGTPLRVVLDTAVPIKHAGEPVEGRLAEPVYAFDRVVVPAGSAVLGKITRVDPVPKKKRIEYLLNADLKPPHRAHVEFDTLVLKDGRRLPLTTSVSQGSPNVMHLESESGKDSGKKSRAAEAVQHAKQQVRDTWHSAVQEVKAPGKLHRLKERALAELPFHSQAWPAGTVFVAELQAPLDFGTAAPPARELEQLGSEPPSGSLVHAFLVTPLSSATSHRDTPVQAMISQPLFSHDDHLILPQGSLLQGIVVQAQPARNLHRNGQLRIVFQRIALASGLTKPVDASLEGLDVASGANLRLDSEGGTSVTESKRRLLGPAIAVALASSSTESNHGDGPTGTSGNQAANGTVGLGVVGTLVGLASHGASSALGIYGASRSVYAQFLSRGSDVVFPADTPMEIGFGTHSTSPQKPEALPRPGPADSCSSASGWNFC